MSAHEERLLFDLYEECKQAGSEPSILLTGRMIRDLELTIKKLRVRRMSRSVVPAAGSSRKLHLGSGSRRIPGWLNVDLTNSDFDLDLLADLPWQPNTFDVVLAQHLIEHLDPDDELPRFLAEVHRVCAPGASVWLSCPDMAKVVKGYLFDKGVTLLARRLRRWPGYADRLLPGIPPQDIINHFFHQRGEHKQLFDFELLSWVLARAGFSEMEEISEEELLRSYPEILSRNDSEHVLTVKCRRWS